MSFPRLFDGYKSGFLEISASRFIFILALANLVFYHLPLLSYTTTNLDIATINGVLTLFTVSLIIFCVTAIFLFLLFIISRWVALPIIIIICLLNATALYFMLTYQVVFDKTMVANIFNTRALESNDYFHPKLVLYVLLLGVLPAWMALKCRIKKISRFRLLLHAVFTLVLCLLLIYLNAATSLWIDKNASNLGSRILPWSYLINTAKHQHATRISPSQRTALPPISFIDNEKSVVVLVIGETARAQNFSLYGYERETNPLLSKTDIVTLNDTTACSTYTTASISCMLSPDANTDAYEPLPTYLNRQGVDVIWHSNNWGEPPVSVNTYRENESLQEDCQSSHCDYDEVLLSGLKQRIESSDKQKILVILHTSGSHGPSYYAKYPAAFEVFNPVCKSVALDQCTAQELVNAYDNSLLYTDYFLSQLIELLQTIPQTPTAMMYVSDHGESLGEYGLYLHGTPFTIAPDVQKKVPLLLWMSPRFMKQRNISTTDFKQQNQHSHRHIFHSIMGALGLQSAVYEAAFDIFVQPHHKQSKTETKQHGKH